VFSPDFRVFQSGILKVIAGNLSVKYSIKVDRNLGGPEHEWNASARQVSNPRTTDEVRSVQG